MERIYRGEVASLQKALDAAVKRAEEAESQRDNLARMITKVAELERAAAVARGERTMEAARALLATPEAQGERDGQEVPDDHP